MRSQTWRKAALEAVRKKEDELFARERRLTARLLDAFREERVSGADFQATWGYGFDDRPIRKLEAVFARMMGCEDAFVRTQIVSGTHAITLVLEALVAEVGGTLAFVFGEPYDTLAPLVGGRRGLLERGVRVEVVPFHLGEGVEDVAARLPRGPGVAWLQRSMGYQDRPTVRVAEMRRLVPLLKERGFVVAVDNCYGEWTEDEEPGHVGADVVVGSLLKNAGGGMSPYGAYVAGSRPLIRLVAERLFGIPLGRRVAPHEPLLPFFQGLFLGPHFVGQALRTATYAASLFAQAGFPVRPSPEEPRGCIVQAITLGEEEHLARFCRAIQETSPVDAHLVPLPADVPGYADPIVMAGGTFIPGGSLELTADARWRPPYEVFVQGGLSFAHATVALDRALEALELPGTHGAA